MLQGHPVGLTLLQGVLNEDLQRERQQLARVRRTLPLGPGMPEVSTCRECRELTVSCTWCLHGHAGASVVGTGNHISLRLTGTLDCLRWF